MNALFLLIPLSCVLIAIAAVFLLAAIHGGQFDELDRQQQRLPDDD